MFETLCLFCRAPASLDRPRDTVVNLGPGENRAVREQDVIEVERGTVKREVNLEERITGEERDGEDSCLEDQLKAVFILSKVLNVEGRRLEEYLGRWGENPGDWFWMCTECNEIVLECWKIVKEIGKWERKLEGRKRELREKVEETGRRLEDDLTNLIGRAEGDDSQLEDQDLPQLEASSKSASAKRKRYRCNLCVASYNSKSCLSTHQSLHKLPSDQVDNCDRCGWTFKAPFTIKHHKKRNCLFPEKLFRCSKCPAYYPSSKRLQQHLWLHQQGKAEAKECPKCGWIYSSKIERRHMVIHQETDFGVVMNKLWRVKRTMSTKFKKGEGVEEIPWYCDYCHLIFPSRATLTPHVLIAHRGEKLVECNQCLPKILRFESKQLLRLHGKIVHGNEWKEEEDQTLEGEQGKCSHCSEQFTSKLKKDYHVAKEHKKEQLICPVCKEFKAKEFNVLKAHIKMHDKTGTVICKFCSNRFYPAELPRHMKGHSKQLIKLRLLKMRNARQVKGKLKNRKVSMVAPAKVSVECHQPNKVESGNEDKHLVVESGLPVLKPTLSQPEQVPLEPVIHVQGLRRSGRLRKPTYQKILQDEDDLSSGLSEPDQAWDSYNEAENNSSSDREEISPDPTPLADNSTIASKPGDASPRINLKCSFCVASFKSEVYLEKHLKIHQLPPEKQEQCQKCGWTYKAPMPKATHRKHYCPCPNKLFRCLECPAEYPTKSRLDKHLWLHGNGKKDAKECPKCGWIYSRKIDKRHMSIHQELDFGVGSDKKWRQKFTEPGLLLQKKGTPWYCDFCHFILPSRRTLIHHVGMAHRKETLTECRECQLPEILRFESKQLLLLHQQVVHGGELVEEEDTVLEGDLGKCPHCSERCPTKLKRDFHIAMEHKKEQLICPVCKEYQAKDYNTLGIHMRKHKKKIWVKCNVCCKKLRQASLKSHMKLMHPADKLQQGEKSQIIVKVKVITKGAGDLEKDDNGIEVNTSQGLVQNQQGLEEHVTDADDQQSDPDWQPQETLVMDDDTTNKGSSKPVPDSVGAQVLAAEAELAAIVSQASRKEHQCSQCIASYDDESFLESHLKLHDMPAESLQKCEKCGWVCSTDYKHHKLRHCVVPLFKYCCKQCDSQFNSKKWFITHLNRHEKQPEAKTRCEKCGWRGLWYLLKRHLQETNHSTTAEENNCEQVPFYCDHCHLIYTAKTDLVRHVALGHKENPMLECDICQGTKFESKQLLGIHRKVVHGVAEENATEDKEKVACPHCPEKFESKAKRDFHIGKSHRLEQLLCPICKEFQAKEFSTLKAHMRVHDKNDAQMCELCSKMVRTNAVSHHRQLFHFRELGLDPIQCDECGMRFGTKTNLRKHVDFVHTNNVANSCPECPKKFRNKGDLDKHIKAHQEPTQWKYKKGPFFCQKCPSQFNVRQALYYHMKREHSNQYPYRCDKCGKGYCFENTLLDHQKRLCKK